MEIFEKINICIKNRKLTKKEFAKKLILLEPKLKSTGEMPTEQAIYSYLNGNREIKIELISYIAEALEITEQELFDDTEQTRIKYLKHILNNPSKKELELIKKEIKASEINIKNSILADINSGNINSDFKEAMELLQYAPIPFLQKLISKLKEIKKIANEF